MKFLLKKIFSPKNIVASTILLVVLCISSLFWGSPLFGDLILFDFLCGVLGTFIIIALAYLSPKHFLAYVTLFIVSSIMTNLVMAIIALIFIYVAWGTIFSMEVLLCASESKGAKTWFLDRYNSKSFKIEYIIFYPLMWIIYLFLEIIPNLMSIKSIMLFYPHEIYNEIMSLLKSKT